MDNHDQSWEPGIGVTETGRKEHAQKRLLSRGRMGKKRKNLGKLP